MPRKGVQSTPDMVVMQLEMRRELFEQVTMLAQRAALDVPSWIRMAMVHERRLSPELVLYERRRIPGSPHDLPTRELEEYGDDADC